ncbi:uncharacterized protein LOC116304934 [Actinia tenebrosa]|uniref:Uncharacterized protein LOC116304934 n=1 Tax=Actinia tenebrosa TaxID=6105 RepID=A0A6P8IU75_ACTTE|nr:uncharacterized protein LOC116304934 [Actinia tenebrosa]
MDKDVLQYAKMEKADILDMAVKYIKCIQTAKQESRDGALGPPQGNHQASLLTSPPDKATINNTSRRQSNTPDIDSESFRSVMIGLVQPEVPEPYLLYNTMATTKNHASSSIPADYALIPSSSFNNDLLQPITTKRQGSNSPTCDKISSCFSSQSLGKFDETLKMRSPLTEKKFNVFSTQPSDIKKLLLPVSLEKRQNTSLENQSRVRLPGMECFVKDTYMAEYFKENQIYNNDVLMSQQRELEMDQFDSGQYTLPLWRPW